MRRQYNSDTTSILCPFIIMSPHLCFPPVITRAEFFWGDLFFERPLYCAKPQLINVLRFATHAIIIHPPTPFCLWQSAIPSIQLIVQAKKYQ